MAVVRFTSKNSYAPRLLGGRRGVRGWGLFAQEQRARNQQKHAERDARIGDVEDHEGAEIAEMQVGEVDDIAEAHAVDDIAERAAEDHRERDHIALCLFARHPEGDRGGDDPGHRDERPARRVGAAREHRQRNAAVFGPGQVEKAGELDLPLGFERQRDGHDPLGDLVEDEGDRGENQTEAQIGRTCAAHAEVNTVSQRLHKLPSVSTSGKWRQQRPHLWLVVGVTAMPSML